MIMSPLINHVNNTKNNIYVFINRNSKYVTIRQIKNKKSERTFDLITF